MCVRVLYTRLNPKIEKQRYFIVIEYIEARQQIDRNDNNKQWKCMTIFDWLEYKIY